MKEIFFEFKDDLHFILNLATKIKYLNIQKLLLIFPLYVLRRFNNVLSHHFSLRFVIHYRAKLRDAREMESEEEDAELVFFTR